MSQATLTRNYEAPRVKEQAGWTVAGEGLRRAVVLLSDGALKLFTHIYLEAGRRSGRFQAPLRQLATTLNKSKRILGSYAAELQEKGFCEVRFGKNQFDRTTFEICDWCWPYHQEERTEEAEPDGYVARVREAFLALGCGKGRFGPDDERVARKMEKQGIPLELVQDAILVGSARKYTSLLNGGSRQPIGSLRYFEALIAELEKEPLPEGYREYIQQKNEQMARSWGKATELAKGSSQGGCPDKGAPEIVQ